MTGTVAPDGSMVVGVGYPDALVGHAGGLATFAPSRKQTRFVSTERLVPCHLAFGPDGIVWALGWLRSANNNSMPDPGDCRMVRKYGQDLKESGAFAGRVCSRRDWSCGQAAEAGAT